MGETLVGRDIFIFLRVGCIGAVAAGDGRVGGVRGAYPVNGEYGRYEYLNWAAKFCIDSQLMEMYIDDLLEQSKVHYSSE